MIQGTSINECWSKEKAKANACLTQAFQNKESYNAFETCKSFYGVTGLDPFYHEL
jgi:hypothetical protein